MLCLFHPFLRIYTEPDAQFLPFIIIMKNFGSILAFIAVSFTFVSGLAIPADNRVEARSPYPIGRTPNSFISDLANGIPDAAEIFAALEPKKGKAAGKFDDGRR